MLLLRRREGALGAVNDGTPCNSGATARCSKPTGGSTGWAAPQSAVAARVSTASSSWQLLHVATWASS